VLKIVRNVCGAKGMMFRPQNEADLMRRAFLNRIKGGKSMGNWRWIGENSLWGPQDSTRKQVPRRVMLARLGCSNRYGTGEALLPEKLKGETDTILAWRRRWGEEIEQAWDCS